MSDKNPIYFSDLVKDDGSIDAAIANLNELKAVYIDLANTIKTHAAAVKSELDKVSSATDGGRKSTGRAADDATRLENAYKELNFALSETGAQVAELKMLTNQANKDTRATAQYVQANATSYDELKASLILATAEYKKLTKEEALNTKAGAELLAQILSLKTQILEYDKAMKVATQSTNKSSASQKAQKVVLTEVEKAQKKLAFATSEENAEVLKLMASVKEANTVTRLNAVVATEAEGSYNRLSAQYSLNKIALNKMSLAERETTESGKLLVTQTNEIYQEMIRLQEVTGKHTLSVGNYKKTWDGLGMSVNQIVREVPAAAVSINTFFLAISNNVPIFVDEINRMRETNKMLVAEGQKSVSIFKSILRSVFSFNTVIIVLLTVFAMFGRQIIEFIGNMFKSKKAIDDNRTALERYNEVMLEGRKDAQGEITRLKLLYNATQDVTKTIDERKTAVQELQKLYPDYFKNLNEEQILAGEAADSYITLAASILKAAMARAAEEEIIENSKKILTLQAAVNEQVIEYNKLQEKLRKEQKSGSGASFTTGFKVESYKDAINENIASINRLQAANEKLASGININDLMFGGKDPKEPRSPKGPKEPKDDSLKLLQDYTDSIVALTRDEFDRKAQELKIAFGREKSELEAKLLFDKTLTEDVRDALNGTILNKEEKLNRDLVDLEEERNQRIFELNDAVLEAQQRTIELRIENTREGSEEENRLRIELLEKTKERELKANEVLTEDIKQSEADIIAKYDALMLKQEIDFSRELALQQFDKQQELAESEFNIIKRTEKEKTIFKLQQEKERWNKILELTKLGLTDLTDQEITTIQNLITAIDREIAETSKGGLFGLFPVKLDSKQQSALKEATSIIIDNFKQILDAQVELADAAVEASQMRIDAATKALDAEIEARNNGYAHNISTAQKELAEARKIQTEKLKLQEAAIKRQKQLESISQATSLITASANLWSAFSTIPIVGPALAIAAIAAMWGSFALAKVKANQVTKEDTKSYGEGGLEILEGGSHSSGNDISIGKTRDGKHRKAEGGEALAIINKNKTRKYKSVLPDIVNSLNRGIFEHKYGKAYNMDSFGINVSNNDIDLDKIENGVDEIRKQGSKKYFTDSKGNVVEIYKNLKTIYNEN